MNENWLLAMCHCLQYRIGHPKARRNAIRCLAKCRQGIPILVRALLDHDRDVEREAEQQLAGLVPGWFDSRRVRLQIARILILLSHPERKVRMNAATAIRTLAAVTRQAMGREAVEACIRGTRDDEELVRQCCAEALGKMRDPRGVDVLIGILGADTERNTYVLSATVHALGEIGDRRAIAPLIVAETRYGQSVGDTVCRAADRALESIDPSWHQTKEAKEAVPKLLSFLSLPTGDADPRELSKRRTLGSGQTNRDHIRHALRSLRLIHDSCALPQIQQLAETGDSLVSEWAQEALNAFGVSVVRQERRIRPMAKKQFKWKNNLGNGANGVARIEARSDKITMHYTEPDLEGSLDGVIYTKWIVESSIKVPSTADACDGAFEATLTPLGRFGRRYATIEGISGAECDDLARALGKM